MLFHGLWLDPEIVDLPLSGCGSGIAQAFHEAGKGGVFLFLPVKVSHPPAWHIPVVGPTGAPWILTRQQGCARGCACRHRIRVIELDPTGGECVDIRGLNILGSVATNPLLAQIIRHNVKNVWLGCSGFGSCIGWQKAGK